VTIGLSGPSAPGHGLDNNSEQLARAHAEGRAAIAAQLDATGRTVQGLIYLEDRLTARKPGVEHRIAKARCGSCGATVDIAQSKSSPEAGWLPVAEDRLAAFGWCGSHELGLALFCSDGCIKRYRERMRTEVGKTITDHQKDMAAGSRDIAVAQADVPLGLTVRNDPGFENAKQRGIGVDRYGGHGHRILVATCQFCASKCELPQAKSVSDETWSPDPEIKFPQFGWQFHAGYWFCGKTCAQRYIERIRAHGNQPTVPVTVIGQPGQIRKLYETPAGQGVSEDYAKLEQSQGETVTEADANSILGLDLAPSSSTPEDTTTPAAPPTTQPPTRPRNRRT